MFGGWRGRPQKIGKGKNITKRLRSPKNAFKKQGHALVKARGFLGSVCVWLTSLLWCFDMWYWRPLLLALPATNLVGGANFGQFHLETCVLWQVVVPDPSIEVSEDLFIHRASFSVAL